MAHESSIYSGSSITLSSSTIDRGHRFASRVIEGLHLLTKDSTSNGNDTINTWFIERESSLTSSGSNGNIWNIEIDECSKAGSHKQGDNSYEIDDEDEHSNRKSHTTKDCLISMNYIAEEHSK